jgi:cytoskeletal protein RodZ
MTTLQDPESLSQFVEAEADATHKEGGALLPRSRPEHHHHRSHSGSALEGPSQTEAPPEPSPVDEAALVKAHIEDGEQLEAPRHEVPDVEVAPQAAAKLDPLQLMQEELARLAHAFESGDEQPANTEQPGVQEPVVEHSMPADIADVSELGVDELGAAQLVELAALDETPEVLEPAPPVKEQMSSAVLNDLLTEALVPIEPEVQQPTAATRAGAPMGWAAALEPPTKKVSSSPAPPPAQMLSIPAALDTATKGPTAPKWSRPEAVIRVNRPKRGTLAKLRAKFSPRGISIVVIGVLLVCGSLGLIGFMAKPGARSNAAADSGPAHHAPTQVSRPKADQSTPKAKPATKPSSLGQSTTQTSHSTASPTTTPVATRTPTGPTTLSSPTVLLSLTSAQKAFSSAWPEFVSAASAGSSSALSEVASPNVVDVALAVNLCGCSSWSSGYSSLSMTSPVETSYPLSFAAQVSSGSSPFFAVLEQESASSPWQIDWLASASGATALSGSTIGMSASASAGALSGPIAQLAQLFEALRTTGKAPAGNSWDSDINSPGTELTTTADQLISDYQASIADQRHDAVTYTATDYSPVFASAGGGFLECAEISAQTVETPAKGGVLVQPPDRSIYGPTLAPGSYSSITAFAARDACVAMSSGGSASLIGLAGGLYDVTGVAG